MSKYNRNSVTAGISSRDYFSEKPMFKHQLLQCIRFTSVSELETLQDNRLEKKNKRVPTYQIIYPIVCVQLIN